MTYKSSPSYRIVARWSLAAVATVVVSLHVVTGQVSVAQNADHSGATVSLAMAPATHPCVQGSVSGSSVSTALGQCSAPAADGVSIDHFEADLRYGSFDAHRTDLVPYDFSAVPLVRSYVSQAMAFKDAVLDGSQPLAFGLNTSRFFDGSPIETKIIGHIGAKTVQEIRFARGSSIVLGYDSRSRIWEADDDRKNTARYFYGSDGMLCYAFNTNGMIRHYTYDGTLMTAVEDEHRRTLVRNTYTGGHLSAQKYANGDAYEYAYTWLPGGKTAGSVTVTLPDHSTKVVSFADQAQGGLGTR